MRVAPALAAVALLVVGLPEPAAAHGIGGRTDLPVPLGFFMAGAATAIVVSFVALAYSWHQPRWQDPPATRAVRWRVPPAVFAVLRTAGLAGLGLVIVDGLIGGTGGPRHISPVLVWVVFWLVVPYLVAGVGNLWLTISPWRTLGNAINGDVTERPNVTSAWGVWPATVGFVAFTWLELVSPRAGEAGTLAVAAILYTIGLVAITRWVGVETGLASFDAFEVYNRVLAALAPIEWRASERRALGAMSVEAPLLVWRGWLRGLPQMDVNPGMTWFVVATIGTVTYDGLSTTEWWVNTLGSLARTTWFGTFALIGLVLTIGAGYYLAAGAAASAAGRHWGDASSVADSFVHTLIPIALAYAFSHYFTLVLFEGQQLLHAASDPFGLGWDLFGTASWRPVFFLAPVAVWWIQLTAIVAGHIAATVLAHDRALKEFGSATGIRSQYVMLILMVALTSLGLFILAG